MKRSIMKRGKEAGVSEELHSLTTEQLLTELRLGGDIPMSQLRDMAADTIQALRQRCKELEAECRRAWGTADRIANNNPDQKDRIAALKGALIEARKVVMLVGDRYGRAMIKDVLKQIDQALSAREEPGECICPRGNPNLEHRPDCPIHGTGRQSEGG